MESSNPAARADLTGARQAGTAPIDAGLEERCIENRRSVQRGDREFQK
jgi:hypothetical protein